MFILGSNSSDVSYTDGSSIEGTLTQGCISLDLLFIQSSISSDVSRTD